MVFSSLLCVSLLIAGAFAGSKQDANFYIDVVLRDHLPGNVRSLNLDPVGVPAFIVKVDSTGLTNRDIKAEFRPGNLYGLSSTVRRHGDCGIPGWQGANVTVGCYVSLDGLRLTFDGSVKGFDLIGSKKDLSVDLVVEKTNALVEATSWQGKRTLPPLPGSDNSLQDETYQYRKAGVLKTHVGEMYLGSCDRECVTF